MSRQRFLALAVAAVLAISGALYISTQRNLPRDTHGTPLLPSLSHELNTITALSVRRGSATPTVTVRQQGGRWTVAERGDYPADVSKLRKLLLALNDAKIIEEKTANPTNFPVIGVEDPSLAGATGAEISIVAQDGKHSVIVGKPVGGGNFARRGGENTSYLVEPGISFEAEPRYWIDSRLIDFPGAGIRSIEVKPAAGPAYSVHRAVAATANSKPVSTAIPNAAGTAIPKAAGTASPVAASTAPPGSSAGTGDFVLDGIPPGRKAVDSASLAPSSTAYSGLSADDVMPLGGIDFSKAVVATLTLTDGSTVTLSGATSGDKHWISVKASKDAALDAKTAGRAFEIAGYRYDEIFRPLEQLLVPKEPPPGAKKAAPASGKKTVPAPTS